MTGGTLDKFLFSPVNTRSVRLFSVCTAAMIALMFNPFQSQHPIFYGDPILGPLQRLALTPVYYGLILLITALFALGVRPRVSGAALVVVLLPLDFMTRFSESRQILLFTLLSLTLLAGGKSDKPLPMWPVRLIQLQLSVIYASNAIAKSSPAFLSGEVLTAMGHTLSNFVVEIRGDSFMIGTILVPASLAAVSSALIEYALAIGFWFPALRWPTAVLGVAFHLLLKSIVQIGFLDWTSMFLYLSFLMGFERKKG